MNAVTTAIAEYNPIEAALADLAKRHKGVVFDVTKASEMKAAKAAAREIAVYRIALEKKRVELKSDVLERGRLIDGEAKRISAQLAAIEDPIVDQIKAEERREQEAREAAIRAEQERLAAEERARKAAEEAMIAAQRAEIARQHADIERQRKEQEARDAEARRKIIAEEFAAKARIAEADRQAKEARDAADALLQAERTRVDAERRALQDAARAAQFAKDEAARAVRLEEQRKREAEENARAEAERHARQKEAERLDSRRMLETFCDRFGHLHPDLVRTIRAYLSEPVKVAA